MDIIDQFFKYKNLPKEILLNKINSALFISNKPTEVNESNLSEVVKLLVQEENILSNIPTTVALKATTEEAKTIIQTINTAILARDKSQFISKTFKILVNENYRTIDCLYAIGSLETVSKLLKDNALIFTKYNKYLISVLSSNLNKFNFYFIRRRGPDQRWYLMLQIELKQ